MTRLANDPSDFADEAAAGFVSAFSSWVRRVPGGVVRRERSTDPRVAVVIGGGSGHYPAFAGLVGPGLAAGAAMGNLFASPSSQQVHSVANAAAEGAGVLLSYGNYAGDVLNFDAAAERLRAQGIPVETVVVTDDISSAGPAEAQKRRGIAGGLIVYKVAAAAADAGLPLAEVAAVARLANERVFSLGVAFSGCTLPGATEPLFTVPEGRMAVGMGIHGEPGIDETDVPTAAGLAELLVGSLLRERPADGDRVIVLLNGLGSVKYEELFVLYGEVARQLQDAHVTIVEPEVGELITSFDMAGVSLTLCWTTPELECYWAAPASTPAFRKGAVTTASAVQSTAPVVEQEDPIPPAAEESRAAAPLVVRALEAIEAVIRLHADELGRIDAVAGDGDHGIGMQRGAIAAAAAAREALSRGAGAGTTLARAADAWSDRAGGTSGALWGLALDAVATAIGDDAPPSAETLSRGVNTALAAIVTFGKAQLGDKTMVDVLQPFAMELSRTVGQGLPAAWAAAVEVAEAAASQTARLVPRIGRARPHAERSVGTPDAGAVSLALIVRAVGTTIEEQK